MSTRHVLSIISLFVAILTLCLLIAARPATVRGELASEEPPRLEDNGNGLPGRAAHEPRVNQRLEFPNGFPSTRTPTATPTATRTRDPLGCVFPTLPAPVSPTSATGDLPDLVITSMSVTLENVSCAYTSTRLGVRIWFGNFGPAAAGPFAVYVNGEQKTVINGLAAGQTASLWFPGYPNHWTAPTCAMVDVSNQVQESNEANNQAAQRLAVPTLPATCTRTPTPSPTPTNTPTPRDANLRTYLPLVHHNP